MTWGTGYFGQLGHGDNVSYRNPRLLRRLDPQRLGERVIQVGGWVDGWVDGWMGGWVAGWLGGWVGGWGGGEVGG